MELPMFAKLLIASVLLTQFCVTSYEFRDRFQIAEVENFMREKRKCEGRRCFSNSRNCCAGYTCDDEHDECVLQCYPKGSLCSRTDSIQCCGGRACVYGQC